MHGTLLVPLYERQILDGGATAREDGSRTCWVIWRWRCARGGCGRGAARDAVPAAARCARSDCVAACQRVSCELVPCLAELCRCVAGFPCSQETAISPAAPPAGLQQHTASAARPKLGKITDDVTGHTKCTGPPCLTYHNAVLYLDASIFTLYMDALSLPHSYFQGEHHQKKRK